MRAVRYAGAGIVEPVEEVASNPGPGEVQVRVAYTGLCGTDLHIVQGAMDGRVSRPHILGHEMSGEVAAVGAGVDGWAIGDPVTVMPLTWDGTCHACEAGHEHVCHNLDFIGIDSPGSLQELWNVPSHTLVRLPYGLRLDHAALIEPVAVAVHDVRRSGLGSGEKAVIIGGGPIGLLIASVAREIGAEVLIIEHDSNRRRLIRGLGFSTIDPNETDQIVRVDRWTDGAGADVVFEVSGAAAAVLGATRLTRVRGTIVIVAIHRRPREIDLQRMFWRELRLIAVRAYESADFSAALELVAVGRIAADLLITRIVPLSQTAAAISDLEAGLALKILVDVRDAS